MKIVVPIVGLLVLAAGGFFGYRMLVAKSQATTISTNRYNVATSFIAQPVDPRIEKSDYLNPQSLVLGDVTLGEKDFVGPFASIRGDVGVPIRVGDRTNIQDGVVIHGRKTSERGDAVEANRVEFRHEFYSVYIGDDVSLEPQSQIGGPCIIENGTVVGMQALVTDAHVGKHCFIGPHAVVIGVLLRNGRYVSPGQVVTDQAVADNLPLITVRQRKRQDDEVDDYVQLTAGYLKAATATASGEPGKKSETSKSATAAASGE